MNVPWVESPFFRRELNRRPHLTDQERELATRYHEQGYIALEQAVPHELCDRVRAEVEPLFEDPMAVKERRVQDVWRTGCETVRELAILPSIQKLLGTLYGRRPIPFQTLDFKWGTEQRGHSDSVHFSCMPARYMCGVWVAIEDVDDGNGPLFYYPGSHRLPELNGYDLGATVDDYFYPVYEDLQHELMDELGLKPMEFHARKGDVLIWSSNIIHGGRPVQRTGSTRWSQVTHFFFEDCIYYQPHSSELPTGELRMLDVVDLNTLERVEPSYNGKKVWVQPLGNSRSRLSMSPIPPEPADAPSDPVPSPIRASEPDMAQALSGSRQSAAPPLRHFTPDAGLQRLRQYPAGRSLLRAAHRVRDRFS